MFQPKIAVIILNWNGWQDTIECLESLYQIAYENYAVFLLDNASTDDSILKIAEYCKGNILIESPFFTYSTQNKPVALLLFNRADLDDTMNLNRTLEAPVQTKLLLIKNERNYGFAEANNIGIRRALETQDPDYFLLLNNDTVVEKQFLTELVSVAESDRSIGIVGPKTYYYYEPNKIQLAWNAFDFNRGKAIHTGAGDIDKGQYDVIKQTGYVPGSCLLVKKEVVKEVGLLDSRFFCYWEETDFCTRAKKAGYKCIYCWQAKIWHKVSSSSKHTVLRHYYGTRNMFWFMQKHTTKRQYVSFLLYFAGHQFWFAIGSLIVKQGDPYSFLLFLKGAIDGIKGYKH
jgi:GT2 family glycosyltransferase